MPPSPPQAAWACAALLAVASQLSGCTGGGDSGDAVLPGSADCDSTAEFGKLDGIAGWVADHNHFRCMHGAGVVEWDSDLANKAQVWADKLHSESRMFHSDCYGTWPPSGENLAMGYGSCQAATEDGGPSLYTASYDQHCAVASWYGEYYLWGGRGDWRSVAGLGHFTAMVWKGVDAIGCGSAGHYYVCEYGSRHCKGHEEKGGQGCWAPPGGVPHLPNFNEQLCSGGECVQDLGAGMAAGEALVL